MTHQLFNVPPQQPLSAAGRILAGAKARFYLTTTDTPVNVWTTSALNVAHAVPVVADSAGRFAAIYLDPEVTYKVTITDANDVLLYTIDPCNDVLLSQAVIGELLYPITALETAASVTPVNYAYPPGHIYRYGTNTSPGTTNMTTAIQAAINANFVVLFPAESVAFTSLEWKVRRILVGMGARKSVLVQLSSMNGSATPAIQFESGTPPEGGVADDIAEGLYKMTDLGFTIASQTGFYCDDDSQASYWRSDQCRIVSRQAASNGTLPYSTIANQRAIWIDAGGVSNAFFHNHTSLEIRAFDIAVDGDDVVNEQTFHGWIIDCRIAFRITDSSTWNMTGVTVETGVQNARAVQTFSAVSNINWNGGRIEMSQSGCYAVEGDGTTTGHNWRFSGINVVISGDGSGIPGRKWTGTVPNDFVFCGYDNIDGTLKPFVHVPNKVRMLMPNLLVMGGSGLGDSKLTLGRDAGGAEASIENTSAGRCVVTGTNSTDLKVGSVVNARVDDSSTAGNTRFLIFDVDNNTLERVTVGAADSGGVGFKVLRIPN